MASKSKRRRKVLGASCILAALIIAGSSFAWFTSKDEVTNRLTATADYGVSLVEDFTPPKDMTPGQTVNKDVAVVNTGAVDAFVRTSVVNNMTAMKRINATEALGTAVTAGTTYFKLADGTSDTGSMTGTPPNLVSATTPDGATKLYDLRVFGDPTAVTIPSAAIELNAIESFDIDGNKQANEVTTLMAGGQVVVQASTAVAPGEQAVRSGDDINGGFGIIYKLSTHAGEYYMYDSTSGIEGYYKVTKNQDGTYKDKAAVKTSLTVGETVSVEALVRDYSGTGEYKPTGNGLYIFKRSTDTTPVTHSGFYYDSGKFYALNNEAADNTGTKNTAKLIGTIGYDAYNSDVVSSVSGITFLTEDDASTGTWTMQFSATETGSWANAPTAGDIYMKATYHVDGDSNNDRDVVFIIKLADNWESNWEYVADTVTNGTGYFYYNKKLNSGETSGNLIDSVKLADTMTRNNYSQLTYDLKVALESAQVTKDPNGAETADAVVGWASSSLTRADGVITSIDWS